MIKMNKWTMALAAAGVVSLSSVAQAQEAASGAEALAASTTLSGYVSTSYTMNDSDANGVVDSVPQGYWRSGEDLNQFSMDVFSLTLASAQGAGEYAAGYTVQLWAGDAAKDIGTTETGQTASTVEIMQANFDLRLPLGNGLNLKVGTFGTTVGAETYDYNSNAFFTRSFAFEAEPTHHTGVLASYQVTDSLSVAVGAANDGTDSTNSSNQGGKIILGSVSYTLPDSLGPLGGTELYYGTVLGVEADGSDDETDYHYFSASIPLPVEGLSYMVAWDVVERDSGVGANEGDTNLVGHYLSYAVNEKLTVNVRYEHGNINTTNVAGFGGNADGLESLTIGLDYALWENVTSRIEWREDTADDNIADQEILAVNLVYSF